MQLNAIGCAIACRQGVAVRLACMDVCWTRINKCVYLDWRDWRSESVGSHVVLHALSARLCI